MSNTTSPNKRRMNQVLGVFRILVITCALMLVLPNVTLAPIEITKYASAEDPGLGLDIDMKFFRAAKADWSVDFANSSAGMNLTFDYTSGTWQDAGYMYTSAAASATDNANVTMDHIDATDVAGMVEIMYMADTLDTARDTFQMNLTLNASNPVFWDQVAIGNIGATPTLWYRDATGNQSVDLGFTFAADTWYSAIIYFNSNYTVDAEFRDMDTFSVLGSAHVSALNLSSIGNVSLMNITNTHASGGAGNMYAVEYVFYGSDSNTYLGDSSINTALGASTPDDENSTKKIIRRARSADAGTEYRNMSGGDNATSLLQDTRYFGNLDSAPSAITAFQKSNDSWYSPTDMKYIAAMTPEKNTTREHREFTEWNWGDNFREMIIDQILVQYGEDDNGLTMVDHRVNYMNLTVSWPESLREQVTEDFREGVANSDADIEASWYDPTMTASAFSLSLGGAWDGITDGVSDGLDNVGDNSFGFFGASTQGAGEFIGSGFGSTVGTIGDGLWTGTNAAIGSMLDGTNFAANIGQIALNTAGQIIKAPFSLLSMMTGKFFTVIVLVIIGIAILALVFLWKRKKGTHAGGKDTKATFAGMKTGA